MSILQKTMYPHYKIFLIAAFSLAGMAAGAVAAELRPIDEGWIGGTSSAAWSVEHPEFLGMRAEKEPRVWATYLKFALPASVDWKDLVLQFVNTVHGDFCVYGLPDSEWESESLSARLAPGWDIEAFTVTSDAVLLTTGNITSEQAAKEVRLSGGELPDFLRSHAGKEITLIVTKRGDRSCQVISNRADPASGPRLE